MWWRVELARSNNGIRRTSCESARGDPHGLQIDYLISTVQDVRKDSGGRFHCIYGSAYIHRPLGWQGYHGSYLPQNAFSK